MVDTQNDVRSCTVHKAPQCCMLCQMMRSLYVVVSVGLARGLLFAGRTGYMLQGSIGQGRYPDLVRPTSFTVCVCDTQGMLQMLIKTMLQMMWNCEIGSWHKHMRPSIEVCMDFAQKRH